MRNRTIPMVLALLCLAPLVFAAGAKEGAGATQAGKIADAANVNPRGVFPVVRQPTTLKLAMPKNAKIEDFPTNRFTQMIQDKTGVKFDYVFLPTGNETIQKVMLIFASNDLPDVFVNVQFPDATILDYGTQGLIRPLNDLIDAYGVEMQYMWKNAVDDANLKATMTFADGNIYAVPKYSEQTQNTYNHRCYIYSPWLAKLALNVPTTTEEYYQVLKAFKTRDPNGNGKADEIPHLGQRNGLMPSFFVNAFIYDDSNDRLFVKDGKVDVTYTKPEFKEALQYLNRLVNEKLLDPLTFTQDEPSLKTLMNQPDVLIGSFAQSTKTGVLDRNIAASNRRSEEYAPLLPLKGPRGVQLTFPTPTIPQPFWIITSACKSPAAAYRVADYMLNVDVTLTGRLGFKGEDWVVPTNDVIGFNGKPAVFVVKREVWGMKTHNVHWQFSNPGFFPRFVIDGTAWDKNPVEYNYVQWNNSMAMSKFVPTEFIPPKLSMTMDEMNQYAQIEPSLNSYLRENIAKFIVGDPNKFSAWDAFLAEFDKLKLKDFLKIMQSAYDRTVKK